MFRVSKIFYRVSFFIFSRFVFHVSCFALRGSGLGGRSSQFGVRASGREEGAHLWRRVQTTNAAMTRATTRIEPLFRVSVPGSRFREGDDAGQDEPLHARVNGPERAESQAMQTRFPGVPPIRK